MKTILTILITLLFTISASGGEITKNQKLHHSVTENGTIQVRLITEYVKDGNVIKKDYGKPMTPSKIPTDEEGNIIPQVDSEGNPVVLTNVNGYNLTGWDTESKDIVTAITDPTAQEAFTAEKQTPTGVGIEEIVTYDRTVDDLGRISVRKITRIFDNGKQVSKKFHRSWIMPGQDTSKADVMSKEVAKKLHTQAVKDAYTAKMTELSAENTPVVIEK
jgi:hypothetical protein